MTAIEEEIVAYHRRGDEPLYTDDLAVGESLGRRLKGPLALNDIIAFSIGIGISSSE